MKRVKLYLTLIAFIAFSQAKAQTSFTPGNIVVCRVGNGGSTAFTTTLTYPVFLDEYTPNGVKVQTIALPAIKNAANHALAMKPSILTGLMTLSANKRYLAVFGYDTIIGVVPSSAASVTPRSIALIKYDASIDLTTSLTDCGSLGFPIAVTTDDGANIWVGSNASASPDVNSGQNTSGIRFTTKGANSSGQISSVLTTDLQALNIAGTSSSSLQLYCSGNGFVISIGSVGSGLPTTGGQGILNLPGLSSSSFSSNQFVFFDESPTIAGVDVLYAAVGSTIVKYSFDGNNWVSNGSVTQGARNVGLTGFISGNTVNLFATCLGSNSASSGGGQLVKLVDVTGYNGNITTTPPTVTTFLDLTANDPINWAANTYSLKGVAMAPQNTVLPVILTTIGANSQNDDIVINWQTATETNTNTFVIQRSFNTLDFTSIGKLPARGDNSNYQFSDRGIVSAADQQGIGVVYYRLQMIDKDGSNTYSQIVSVKLSPSMKLVDAYPNPFIDAVTVKINIGSAHMVNFVLIDMAGKTIKTMQVKLAAGDNTVTIPELAGLGKGTYFLKAVINGSESIIKLIK